MDPVNKGEVVWTVNIQDLAIIGRLFNEGRVDMTKIIAVAGSEIEKPQYCRIIAGAKVDSVLKGNLKPPTMCASFRATCLRARRPRPTASSVSMPIC